ncbi:MAG: HipA N-terminal domain-containing protein [Ignavibacteria bacterium]|nr:HipA N-terminal domain-containing protein [Ignavibacteria bacterium]
MENKAEVYFNDTIAGYLIKTESGFHFFYDDAYYFDATKPAISLTLPKTQKDYFAENLFPFFYGLLSEGDLKTLQCRQLGIDENDHFTRLIKTGHNTIGAISVKEVSNE